MAKTASRSICIPSIERPSVIASEQSWNTKLSLDRSCSTTSVSQATCPKSCAFLNEGCFTENHPQSIFTKLLNASEAKNVDLIACYEAYAIDLLTGRFPLRLHVVGDLTTLRGVKRVAAAVARYRRRGDQVVWTYSHDWRKLPRDAWGEIEVLASCETEEDAEQAISEGYAPALVVEEFQTGVTYKLGNGLIGIPCPQETGRRQSCVKCQLCWHTESLRRKNMVILFHAHGSQKERVKNALRRRAQARKDSTCTLHLPEAEFPTRSSSGGTTALQQRLRRENARVLLEPFASSVPVI